MDARQNHRGHVINSLDQGQGPLSKSIDWYAVGEARDVEFGGVRMTVRFVGRKGRRARIAITGPAGAVFRGLDSKEATLSLPTASCTEVRGVRRQCPST
jgi:hypothetical protein